MSASTDSQKIINLSYITQVMWYKAEMLYKNTEIKPFVGDRMNPLRHSPLYQTASSLRLRLCQIESANHSAYSLSSFFAKRISKRQKITRLGIDNIDSGNSTHVINNHIEPVIAVGDPFRPDITGRQVEV